MDWAIRRAVARTSRIHRDNVQWRARKCLNAVQIGGVERPTANANWQRFQRILWIIHRQHACEVLQMYVPVRRLTCTLP